MRFRCNDEIEICFELDPNQHGPDSPEREEDGDEVKKTHRAAPVRGHGRIRLGEEDWKRIELNQGREKKIEMVRDCETDKKAFLDSDSDRLARTASADPLRIAKITFTRPEDIF